jgi:hypothetical protein
MSVSVVDSYRFWTPVLQVRWPYRSLLSLKEHMGTKYSVYGETRAGGR